MPDNKQFDPNAPRTFAETEVLKDDIVDYAHNLNKPEVAGTPAARDANTSAIDFTLEKLKSDGESLG